MTVRSPIRHALLALVLVCVAALPAAAQGLQELKIGVVDVNEAMNRSTAGERSKSILLSSKSQLESDLKAKEEELKKKAEALKNNIMLSDEARAARESELRDDQKQLRRDVQEAQRELQDRERKLTESIFIELRTVIEAIAKEEKYDLVLEKNAASVVLYSKAKMEDMTEKVIDRYNKFNAAPK